MKKDLLLFYREYEAFYQMAAKSDVFSAFCKKAFGGDFSQDGFSDISQVDRILEYIPKGRQAHILDIGCGNGKMLAYLQGKTGAFIHGFDYSEQAVMTAKKQYPHESDFRMGVIGEIEYPKEMFDLIVSMDTMYFASDMSAFVGQLWSWLAKGGTFFALIRKATLCQRLKTYIQRSWRKRFRIMGSCSGRRILRGNAMIF